MKKQNEEINFLHLYAFLLALSESCAKQTAKLYGTNEKTELKKIIKKKNLFLKELRKKLT